MPDAIETSIIRLLIARLEAFTPALPIDWGNSDFVPPATGNYLSARVLWNRNINRFVTDDSTTEYRGIFQVSVMVPIKTGIIEPTNIAGAIANHFERSSVMSGSGINVKIEGKPSLRGLLSGPPHRMALPVSIYYYAFN